MLPIFTYPLAAALVGAAAITALTAIYFLRNRFRRRAVSSLMLWRDAREAREGGTKVRRLHTPLLFVLELAAVALLCLAAAEPHVRMTQGTRPLVVVLDDSFSMTANNGEPRDRALDALARELRNNTPYSVRFILAGDRPQLLGETVRSPREAMRVAEGWRCRSSTARIDEAVSLGAELGGELALILVLTDHPPPRGAVPDKGRLRWWSFGKPRGNVAIVNAARTNRDGLDRCLLEIANLSEEERTVRLTVETVAKGPPLHNALVKLESGQTQRVILQPAPGTGALRARIDDDELAIDNEAILQPQQLRPVRVDLYVRDRRLREPLEKGIASAKNAVMAEKELDLLFTDRSDRQEVDANTWVVYVLSEKDATAYTGPFVLDRSHPLTEGLGLRGLIWGAGKSTALDGTPVVMAGNVPLLTDTELSTTGGGTRHEVRLRFNPLLSTLHDSPDWPIFVWNLLNWRGSALPGPSRSNARLGEQVMINLPGYRETVQMSSPSEKARTVSVKGRQIAVRGDEVGTHEVTIDKTTYAFAVNALSRDESDLRECEGGQWGDWLDDTSLRLEYRPVAWTLLLVVLGLVTLHLWLASRAPGAATAQGRVS